MSSVQILIITLTGLSRSCSRCSGHPDPRAGPGHLAGGLGQQQLPGAHLPAHPGAHSLPLGGRVSSGDRQERSHQRGGLRGLPGRNLHRRGADHRPELAEARGDPLQLPDPVTHRLTAGGSEPTSDRFRAGLRFPPSDLSDTRVFGCHGVRRRLSAAAPLPTVQSFSAILLCCPLLSRSSMLEALPSTDLKRFDRFSPSFNART